MGANHPLAPGGAEPRAGPGGRPHLVLRHVAGVLDAAVHRVPQDEAASHGGVRRDVHGHLGRPVGEVARPAEVAALPRVHVGDLHGGHARGRQAPLPPLAPGGSAVWGPPVVLLLGTQAARYGPVRPGAAWCGLVRPGQGP